MGERVARKAAQRRPERRAGQKPVAKGQGMSGEIDTMRVRDAARPMPRSCLGGGHTLAREGSFQEETPAQGLLRCKTEGYDFAPGGGKDLLFKSAKR
jgi:hypothetical protein